MPKRRRLTEVEKAYNKERRRIQRQIRSAEARGFLVPEILPDRPKRITNASANRLKKITLEKVYSKSRYVNQETGEILAGKQGRQLELKRRAQRAAETRRKNKERKKRESKKPVQTADVGYVEYNGQIFFNFQNQMTTIFANNPPILAYIKNWFNFSRQKLGDDEFASVLSRSYEQGMWPSWEDISDMQRVVAKLGAIISLMDLTPAQAEDLTNELEQFEEWSEYED